MGQYSSFAARRLCSIATWHALQRIYECIQPSGQAPQGKISGRLYVSADNGGSSSLADRRIEESSKITEVGGPLPQALVARASTSSRHLMCLLGVFRKNNGISSSLLPYASRVIILQILNPCETKTVACPFIPILAISPEPGSYSRWLPLTIYDC